MTASLGLLAFGACESNINPAPIIFAGAPETTRTGHFLKTFEQVCITPLPNLRDVAGALESTDWEVVSDDQANQFLLFGYDAVTDVRKGLLGSTEITAAVHEGEQYGTTLVACSMEISGVSASALEDMFALARHIDGDPFADMDFAPVFARTWVLKSTENRTPPFALTIEDNGETGKVRVFVSQ
ncbi:MAG: hypothetical protein AAF216_11985 [Pseudomonadota bacterium]